MFTAWKLIPTVLVACTLVAGLTARPPSSPVSSHELIRLAAAVTGLYLVGGIALLDHRTALAAVVFGSGLALCGLAVWLSRGQQPPRSHDDDGGGEEPPQRPNPPLPEFDWSYFEDQFSGDPLGEPVA